MGFTQRVLRNHTVVPIHPERYSTALLSLACDPCSWLGSMKSPTGERYALPPDLENSRVGWVLSALNF